MTQNQNESVTRHVGVKNDTVSKHARSKNETVSKHAEIKDSTIQKHAGSKNETEPKLAEEKNQIVSILHAGLKEGSGLYAFMKNRDLFYEVTQGNASSKLGSRMKPIKYFFKQIRTNLDRAFSAKILVAHKMFMKYDRMKYVPMTQIFKDCQDFSSSYKTLLGADIFQFSIFLRHFPDMFQIHEEYVLLKDIDLYELKRRYRAIILYPHALFNKGVLPSRLELPFKVLLIESPIQGDRIAANLFRKHSRLAVDLEGFNLGIYGTITLVQVSASPDRVYIFDILKCPYFLRRGVLRRVLESDKITKVFHSLLGDAGNLMREFNITLRNVYDTQAAFFNVQVKYPELRLPYNSSESWSFWQVSLSELMALYNLDGHQIKFQVKSLYRANPNLWSYRPLCPALLHYAGEDVSMLLSLEDAMNEHPFYKPDIEAVMNYMNVKLEKQQEFIQNMTHWIMPHTPKARSVIRAERLRGWMNESEWKKFNAKRSARKHFNKTKAGKLSRSNNSESKQDSKQQMNDGTHVILNRSKRGLTLLENYFIRGDVMFPSSHPHVTIQRRGYLTPTGESTCLLVVTIAFLFIILVKWFKHWKTIFGLFRKCEIPLRRFETDPLLNIKLNE